MEKANLEEVRRRLNRQGRRMTPQRAAILDALRSTRDHPTAEQLYDRVQEKMPRISLGTVYRNLQVLVDEGWALRLPNQGGSHRFDGCVDRHHHAVCVGCGTVADVELPDAPDLVRRVEKATGFRSLRWSLEFEGLCPECRAAGVGNP